MSLQAKTVALDEMAECLMRLSNGTQGKSTDWRGVQVSLVFGKLCVTCISFLRIIPTSGFCGQAKGLDLWDLSSAASLCRNLIEAYCMFAYIGSEPDDDEDGEF